jgi:hypothetical protein
MRGVVQARFGQNVIIDFHDGVFVFKIENILPAFWWIELGARSWIGNFSGFDEQYFVIAQQIFELLVYTWSVCRIDEHYIASLQKGLLMYSVVPRRMCYIAGNRDQYFTQYRIAAPFANLLLQSIHHFFVLRRGMKKVHSNVYKIDRYHMKDLFVPNITLSTP